MNNVKYINETKLRKAIDNQDSNSITQSELMRMMNDNSKDEEDTGW